MDETKKTLHGFDGEWFDQCLSFSQQYTTSLGIFPLVPTKRGDVTKRGAVVVRVRGPVGMKTEIKAEAQRIVAELDAGTYKGPKNVQIRPD